MMQNRSVLCKGTRVTRCNAADGTSSKPTRTDQGPKKSRSPEPERLERHRSVEMVFWKNNVAEASKPRTAQFPEKWLLYICPQSPESSRVVAVIYWSSKSGKSRQGKDSVFSIGRLSDNIWAENTKTTWMLSLLLYPSYNYTKLSQFFEATKQLPLSLSFKVVEVSCGRQGWKRPRSNASKAGPCVYLGFATKKCAKSTRWWDRPI